MYVRLRVPVWLTPWPLNLDWPPSVVKRIEDIFRGPLHSREQLAEACAEFDTAISSIEADGSAAREIVAALLERLEDEDKRVRSAAVGTLEFITYPSDLAPDMFDMMFLAVSEPDPDVYKRASRMLTHSGSLENVEDLTPQDLARLLQALDDAQSSCPEESSAAGHMATLGRLAGVATEHPGHRADERVAFGVGDGAKFRQQAFRVFERKVAHEIG